MFKIQHHAEESKFLKSFFFKFKERLKYNGTFEKISERSKKKGKDIKLKL